VSDINATAIAIEQFLRDYEGVAELQVRPSGDDVDAIKIWIDHAGTPSFDAAACERAIRAAVPDAAPYRLQIHAEP
jgi:hypothetical protein